MKSKGTIACSQCGERPEEIEDYYVPCFRHGFAYSIQCGQRVVYLCESCQKKFGKPISVYIGHGERFDIEYRGIV